MSARGPFVWLVLTLMAGSMAWGSEALESTPGYPAIQDAFLREEFRLVTELAQRFVAQHPDVPETPRVWLWLALSLDRLQQPNEALAWVDQLKAALPPDNTFWPEVFFWEGDISRRALQTVRARLAFQRLIARDPASPWAAQAQFGLGLIEWQHQAYEEAVHHFRRVCSGGNTAPSLARSAKLLDGLCLLKAGRLPEAAAVFETLLAQLGGRETAVSSLTIGPGGVLPDGGAFSGQGTGLLPQTAFYLGESLSGLGRHDEAIWAYQRALLSDAGRSLWSQLAEFGMGMASARAGRCQDSVEAFGRYLRAAMPGGMSEPQDGVSADHRVDALFAQGGCLIRLGREAEALSRFEHMVSYFPDHPLGLESGMVLTDAYCRQGRFEEARQLIHMVLRRPMPPASRAPFQLRLGSIALEQGNAAQATVVLTLAAGSEDPAIQQAALSGLGDVQLFLGHLTDARQFYDEALRRRPDTASARRAAYQIGRIELQLGAYDEAIRLFEELAANGEDGVADDARLALVTTHLNRQDEGSARRVLEVVRLTPGSVAAARAAYYLALLALGDGDEEVARTLCQEVLDHAPRAEEAADARLLLADLEVPDGSPRLVMERLKQELTTRGLSRSQQARLARRLGDLAKAEQACEEAGSWYQEAVGLLPAVAGEAAYRTASCYEEAGEVQRAIEWYQRSQQPPWAIRGGLAAAKLLEREGREAEAAAIYTALASHAAPEAKVAAERLASLHGSADNP